MKKKILALLLVLTMALLLFAACAGETEEPAEGTAPEEATGEEAGGDEVYTLEVSYFASGQNTVGINCTRACEEAAELSGGRLQFTNYFDGTYVSWGETIQATIDGVIDIGFVDAGNINEVFDLNKVLNMPVEVALPDRYLTQDALEALLVECPELDQELQDVGLTWLGITDMGASVLHLVNNVEVRNPDDLAGLILDAPASAGTLMEEYGASATILDANDYYISLERGVVDGIWHNWGMMEVFSLPEVTSAHVVFDETDYNNGLWAPAGGWIMNLETWNSLPEDLQQILKQVFSEFGDNWTKLDLEGGERALQDCIDRGHTITYLTQEERSLWEAAVSETNKKILADLDAKGVPATAVYEKYCELLAELNQ